MADILQQIFSAANVWKKDTDILIQTSLKFVLQAVNCQYVCNGSGNGLVLNRQQAITWSNDDPVHWYIYASSGLNELI